MKTFKSGAPVKIIKCVTNKVWYSEMIGKKFNLLSGEPDSEGDYELTGEHGLYLAGEDFELVKETPTFNLKTSPWFIRVNNMEEFNIINEWLEVNFGGRLSRGYDKCLFCLTNTYSEGGVSSHLMWSPKKSKGAEEIKLTFRTSIESVEYPEVKTQQQVAIEELEATIALAKQQISKLKGGK